MESSLKFYVVALQHNTSNLHVKEKLYQNKTKEDKKKCRLVLTACFLSKSVQKGETSPPPPPPGIQLLSSLLLL